MDEIGNTEWPILTYKCELLVKYWLYQKKKKKKNVQI